MERSKFSEEQLIAVLREHECEMKTANVCRKHVTSEAILYKWKAKYGSLEISEAHRLKALRNENTYLKRLLADTMLNNAA